MFGVWVGGLIRYVLGLAGGELGFYALDLVIGTACNSLRGQEPKVPPSRSRRPVRAAHGHPLCN